MNDLDLNVFTKEENFILDLIEKNVDPEEKKRALSRYIEVAKEETRTTYRRERRFEL